MLIILHATVGGYFAAGFMSDGERETKPIGRIAIIIAATLLTTGFFTFLYMLAEQEEMHNLIKRGLKEHTILALVCSAVGSIIGSRPRRTTGAYGNSKR
ncbi:hypothetical protein [Thalassobius sp. Cn5-15]|uniref:hypothetical protein n=1 Tax=Thalassobius sp. Cn5-15 TaxID=2917763 RepID=UPI001EF1CCCD|nr:hypothetical protein [Thalassobius sp. Cn5-15]MCG7492439.1 hypothetical protein [Thalassobius sp. Cn5-15]